MKIDSFHRLYVQALKDIYSAERQLLKAMPKMINACSNNELKSAFQDHLQETKKQVERIEKVFENLEFSPTGHPCHAMMGLIEEAEEIINDDSIPANIKDAGLIAAAQKVEHYEIASYGTAVHFAELFGHNEAYELLSETLQEEKKTDKLLTKLAKNLVNKRALRESKGDEEFRPSV